jgi:2-keto-3-deoxy-L-rhamnonate aldolase RhmA
MTLRRLTFFIALGAIAYLTLAGIQAQGRGAAGGGAPAAGAPAAPAGGAQAPAAGGGRRGGGAGGGGLAQGTLVPMKADARGWGWAVKASVDPKHLPLYNIAKQHLLDGKKVTSYTISRRNPEQYCEVRKHFDFIWFEMQHSTMTWADIEAMIAACPGLTPGAGAPMVRMPDAQEANMQKAGDIGALGMVVPTVDDALEARDAGRYSRYPPLGRRSQGAGQAGTIWGGVVNRQPGTPLIAGAPAATYRESINDNMLVVVMIETVEGVINAFEIASQTSVDVMIEGNSDLSSFSGFSPSDDKYQDLRTRVHDAALKAGKFYGSAGAQYLNASILAADTVLVQNGPASDGWVPTGGRGGIGAAPEDVIAPAGAAPGAGPAGPAGGGGGGRGRRGGGAGAPAPAPAAPAR